MFRIRAALRSVPALCATLLIGAAIASSPARAGPDPQTPTGGPPASPTPEATKAAFVLNGHITSEFAANATGGIPQGGTAVQRGTALATEVGVGFDADLGRLTTSDAGLVHALFTTRFGSSLSTNALGNLVSVQEIYGDGQTTRVTFLDYEQLLFKKKVSLLLGKINQQNDFIAGSTYWGGNLYCFYQNNNICGTPAGIPTNNGVTPGGSAGYNYYPSSMLGARIKVSPSDSVYVEAAALQVDPIVNTSHGGFYFGLYGSTGAELPVEVGLTLHDRAGEKIGDVRVGGYYDTSNVFNYVQRETSYAIPGNPSNAAGLASLPIAYVRGRSGEYVQLDHLLQGSSDKGKRGTAIFASAEYSDPNSALLTTYVDGGVVRHGTFAKRPDDTLALGFAVANFNPRLQQLQLALRAEGYAVPYTKTESALELNYGVRAARGLVIRPGLQYVFNPNGEQPSLQNGLPVPKSALVFGLATDVTF